MADCLEFLTKFFAYIRKKTPFFVKVVISLFVCMPFLAYIYERDENLAMFLFTCMACIGTCVVVRDHDKQEELKEELKANTKALQELRKAIIDSGKTAINKK